MSESFAAGNPPKYEELATELRKRIAGGVYAESGFLPQERMLSEEFKVSRNTMRNALELLVKENLITKVQGRGTVINSFHNEVGEYVVLNLDTSNMSPFVVAMLHEIDLQAGKNGDFVIYAQLRDGSSGELATLKERFSSRRNIKGIILVGRYARPMLKRLRESLLYPLVLLGDVWQEPEREDSLPVSQVVGNDYQKMYLSTGWLLRQGRNRILALGQPRNMIWGGAFYRGFEDAFADAKVKFVPENYCETLDNNKSTRDELDRCIGQLLEERFAAKVPPDGLIFPAEFFGTVQYVVRTRGIRIPQDLLIVGRSVECINRSFPCVATSPTEMIREIFELLKYERDQHGRVKQRRIVGPVWLDPLPA